MYLFRFIHTYTYAAYLCINIHEIFLHSQVNDIIKKAEIDRWTYLLWPCLFNQGEICMDKTHQALLVFAYWWLMRMCTFAPRLGKRGQNSTSMNLILSPISFCEWVTAWELPNALSDTSQCFVVTRVSWKIFMSLMGMEFLFFSYSFEPIRLFHSYYKYKQSFSPT